MTHCTFYDRGLPTQVSLASIFPRSHAVAPCVSLCYLGSHEAIPKLVQVGLAVTEVAQVNVLQSVLKTLSQDQGQMVVAGGIRQG